MRIFCFFFFTLLQFSSFAKQHEKPFVIGDILGQLGNRLFEVATTSALAWDHGAEPCFPDFIPLQHSDDYNHIFFRCNIRPPKKPIEFSWGTPVIGYDPISYHPNMRLYGYMQSEKYFAHQRDRILKLFSPHPEDLKYIQRKFSWILEHPNSVSVHLRYYLREKAEYECFVQYDRDYFTKAMAMFHPSCLFVVVSDNISFAKQTIPTEGRNVVFIEGEKYYIDFFLQSMCKHNIICNSSFSWWAAWLNQNPNKIVVRPKLWLKGFEDMDGPENWIKVEAPSFQDKWWNASSSDRKD